ncbi:MAG: hypothetical protein AB7Q23_04010 [Hyphomonadaceae bacterium]
MSSLVIVARFSSRPECVIAQSLLRSEGIETLMPEFNVLMADFDPSMMEHGWRLLGRAEDAPLVEAILRDAQLQQPPAV